MTRTMSLTVVLLILRLWPAHPETVGVAAWAHRALYACVFLMPMSGFTAVFAARLNDIVFARNGAPLPADMATIPGHWWHGATAQLLVLIIGLHIAGAFKDRQMIKSMV